MHSSSFYNQPAHAQAMPQAHGAQGMQSHIPARIASPAPSMHSTHSGSQNYSQPYGNQGVYQQQNQFSPGHVSAYQPTNSQQTFNQSSAYNPYQQTSYQPASYQQTPYQQSNYQQPTHQQNSFQQSTYQPSGYQSNGYRPTGF